MNGFSHIPKSLVPTKPVISSAPYRVSIGSTLQKNNNSNFSYGLHFPRRY